MSQSPKALIDQPEHWDVVVVGAGPAGSLAAREARRCSGYRASVLLVDKASFPRRKVCGCFLNGSAIATLESLGLGHILKDMHAPRINTLEVGVGGTAAMIPLASGRGLSRESLDTRLAEEAAAEGVQVRLQTIAKLATASHEPTDAPHEGVLTLTDLSFATRIESQIHYKALIVADGLSGQLLRKHPSFTYEIDETSLVGGGAHRDTLPPEYRPGSIFMAVSEDGYVGALGLENGKLDIACAFSPSALKALGPGRLAEQICQSSGLPPIPDITELKWQGTPTLSRTPNRIAAGRIFLAGDAAGYVEPFTGGGMSWALASGAAVADYAVQAVDDFSPAIANDWQREYQEMFRGKKRLCHWLTRGLRSPWLSKAGITAIRFFPSLARPVVSSISTPPARRSVKDAA
ncbi:MAG: FAD-dependent monooxygenase [Planctomycetota bacterium]